MSKFRTVPGSLQCCGGAACQGSYARVGVPGFLRLLLPPLAPSQVPRGTCAPFLQPNSSCGALFSRIPEAGAEPQTRNPTSPSQVGKGNTGHLLWEILHSFLFFFTVMDISVLHIISLPAFSLLPQLLRATSSCRKVTEIAYCTKATFHIPVCSPSNFPNRFTHKSRPNLGIFSM